MTDENMHNPDQSEETRRKLPHPRWLVITAIALAVWAIALGLWWRQLNRALPTARPTPPAAPTRVALVTPQPQPTASATPSGTPATVPVVRPAGPSPNVLAANWVGLARAFDTDRALADISELASPKYAGRAAGSAGGKLAAEWIAQRFRELGLQPAGDAGTYFQEFAVPYAELTAMPTFDLVDSAGQTRKEYRLRVDYTIWPGGYADGGQAEGPVLWVSDGTHADYGDVDAEGAIVLCRWRYPLQDAQRQALEHGAKAILFIRTDYNFAMRRQAREDALLPQGIPTLVVGPAVLEDLLDGSGMTPDDLTIEYQTEMLATRVQINLPLRYDEQATGRNVLGVLPGSDPDGRSQVIILGAHYDHLGADPDGTTWGGANDNASGVAVLLEVARQWQEQGYIPKRTVLFAAWDAEEIGLNGSRFYVQHPSYPLSSTLGMLQLDMVGAGPNELLIDSGGIVADQSFASAATLGIQVRGQSLGSSDHVSFVGAGVPATLYIWWDGRTPGVIYHVPQDDIHTINPTQLGTAGQLTDLVLFDLSWEQEELQALGAQLQQAVSALDLASFSSLLDPTDEPLQQEQESWLEAVQARQPAEFTATSDAALVTGDVATSTLTLRYRWQAADSLTSAAVTARWSRHEGTWYYAGPAWETMGGEHVQVEYLRGMEQAQALLPIADDLYRRIEQEVGPVLADGLDIRLYPSNALQQALQMPPTGYEGAQSWPGDGAIVLNQTSALTTTMLELVLRQAGWPSAAASWLAQGTSERWNASAEALQRLEAQYIPTLLLADADQTLWPAESMPARHDVPADRAALWNAQAWAMTDQVLRLGGLRNPATDVAGWYTTLLIPWRTATEGIQRTLSERAQAVLGQDEAAFLNTVNASDAVLLSEERHWFADLQSHPVSIFELSGQLLALREDHALVRVTMDYQLAEPGSTRSRVIWQARFVPQDGRWLYADVDFQQQSSAHFLLKYVAAQQGAVAAQLLSDAERAYDLVAADLEEALPAPLEIKYYDDPQVFGTSIYLSMPTVHSWSEPGESIKLTSVTTDEIGRIMAHELTHAALFAKGVQHGGVHEGTAQYLAGLYSPQWQYEQVRKWRQQVYDVVRANRDVTLETLDDWRVWQASDPGLIYNMSWDNIAYSRQRFGRETFLRWLDLLGSGLSFEDAFAQATGITFDQFDADWRESVLRGHIPPEDIATARASSGASAAEHVYKLTQPAWDGREAGTAGSDAAVQYVADQFALCGLQPAGTDGSYLQPFTIASTRLITTPELTLITADGQVQGLRYRSDFVELIGGAAGGGQAQQTVVYIHDLSTGELHLDGRIVLSDAIAPWDTARQAQAAGAGALLLSTAQRAEDLPVKSDVVRTRDAETIPVYELTTDAYETLLKLASYGPAQLADAPPALPLPLSARVNVELESTAAATAANVLGVLPGSDPQLAQEVIIVGAQLDGLGRLPDGTLYPGANHDASGIAILLEIARTWHEQGYHPRRTILFAAWNAAELGWLGSEYYVAQPTYPLGQTRAVIQLDKVGQGRGYYLAVASDEQRDALILAHLDNAALQVEGRWTWAKYEASGDQDPFHRRGIPAALVTWERAEFSSTPQDTADRIDANKLQATARVVALTLMTMADEETSSPNPFS
jgi:Zn-dependent M28 family amino/carboxypeptidase